MDTNGKAHKLSGFKGKTVVLEWFCLLPILGKASGARCTPTGKVKKLMEDLKKVDENIVYLLIDSSSSGAKKMSSKRPKPVPKPWTSAPMLIDHGGKAARTTVHGPRRTCMSSMQKANFAMTAVLSKLAVKILF